MQKILATNISITRLSPCITPIKLEIMVDFWYHATWHHETTVTAKRYHEANSANELFDDI